jgi:hypothetical protein
MATLYLHAGHEKTGSSYIQECFRLNASSLARQGIIYPVGKLEQFDAPGRITSGNGRNLFKSELDFRKLLSQNNLQDKKALLFSSEYIPILFIESNGQNYLETIAAEYGFDTINILLFVRNPINMAVSTLQQNIKHQGAQIEVLCSTQKNVNTVQKKFNKIKDFIIRLKNCKNVTLTIRNYSYCSHRLMEEVAGWLEVPFENFGISTLKRVNRSLTFSELIFQSSMNKVLGGSAYFLSHALCERLPDVEPEKFVPPLSVQQKIWDGVKETIERLNMVIPENQRYQFDIQTPVPVPDLITFSRQQIEVMAESLANEILNLRKQLESKNESLAALNEKIAELQFKNNNPFDDKSAKTLVMQVIKRFKTRILRLISQKRG